MHSKWKMVSFRLPAEEYAAVQPLWRAAGYRSISSFALCAMRAFVPVTEASLDSGNAMSDLKRSVDELATDMKRLSESIRERHQLCAICSASLSAGTDAGSGSAGY
jgi:hypothetical protein